MRGVHNFKNYLKTNFFNSTTFEIMRTLKAIVYVEITVNNDFML